MLNDIPKYPGYKMNIDGTKVVSYKSGEEIELKSRVGDNGYISVTMTDENGSRHPVELHRLVGLVSVQNFTGLSTDDVQINHIDRNKLNNHPSNLEWCTQSVNIDHAYETGHGRGRRVLLDRLEDGALIEIATVRKAAEFFGVSQATMQERMQKRHNRLWDGYILGYID